MYPVIAALIAIAIVVLMWRYLEPRGDSDRRERFETLDRPTQPRVRRKPRTTQVAPDDDPEFLRKLREQIAKDRPVRPRDGDNGVDEDTTPQS